MDWGDYENRVAIIALHKVGKSPAEIFEILKKLKFSRMFVYRTSIGSLRPGLSATAPGKVDRAK